MAESSYAEILSSIRINNSSSADELLHRMLLQQGGTHYDTLNRRVLVADGLLDATGSIGEARGSHRLRIAIVSLLFNWPSTGGGIVHTAELAKFLAKDGHDVCHFYACYPEWGVGRVEEDLGYASKPLYFGSQTWNREQIFAHFRKAISEFRPSVTIVTDSWNSKGLLARAVSEFPYFIRLAAMECLCPLNNVRLLVNDEGRIFQCRNTQLANSKECLGCVARNVRRSGSLHREERDLCGFGTKMFDDELRKAFSDARSVLVVNPLIGTLCESYSRDVRVIPSGFDAVRFDGLPADPPNAHIRRILFAGLPTEFMKGFHVAEAACRLLWKERQDFELVTTSDSGSASEPFLRFVGWKSQAELPRLMADCDMIVVPTIAQEALGRTAVEGMGARRAVIASRIGGLPYTVNEHVTGLLFEPGNPQELRDHIRFLLNRPDTCREFGLAGRVHFENNFAWDQIMARHYRPLFADLQVTS